ncbi:AAA ATPase [Nitrosococcus halophilus Nc 4]|uniref:AAA ATPase n=1 Tax=Nitrosococcus halophilus (strain Nc4) TaxID=472759 RepID=D5BZB5_NITHN|nr:AAA family ATPase [Nitrosococcus halophilus]ADE16129.1 AAA ATPase [Nitrosococcus halophilus Nc 4]
MYTHYFGLKDHPFRLVPDPHYFFPAPFHKLVSKRLLEGLISTLRMAVISGPPGVGKTLLLTRFMEQLGKTYPVIFISNPKLPLEELLAFIQNQFDIIAKDPSVNGRLSALEAFGQDISQTGKRLIILVDEADSLSQEAVQALFKLTNPAETIIPPFFIVLAVRNNASEHLSLLLKNQDVVKGYSLLPLLADQISPYIDLRLRQAGYANKSPFSPEAIARLAEISHGIPRLINRLCDAALLEASLIDKKLISPQIIDEVAQGLWLALGNENPSGNPPLAKGIEAAFSPKTEKPLPHNHQATATPPTSTEPREEDTPAQDESRLPPITPLPKDDLAEGTSTPKNITQPHQDVTSSRQDLRISGKKTQMAIALGATAVLIIASFYLLILAPGRTSLPSAAEFTELFKGTTNKAENLAEEKAEESLGEIEIAANQILPPSLEKNGDETALAVNAGSEEGEASIHQEIQETMASYSEPQADSTQTPPPLDTSVLPAPIAQPPAATSQLDREKDETSSEGETEPLLQQKEQQQDQNTPMPEANPKKNPVQPSQTQRIALLLKQAKQQEADFKLTTPEGDNAYETYTKILKMVPNHSEVAKGLQRIRDYYVNWGLKAENQKQLDLATVYYKRALSIFPDDFALRTALQRVQARQEANQP